MRIRNKRVSSSSSSSSSRSRRRGLRKKQKRLDAICEEEYNRNRVHEAEANGGGGGSGGSEAIRRSSRLRKAPEILDVSPLPARKRRRTEGGVRSEGKKKEEEEDGGGVGGWKLRLRSTVHSANVGLSEKIVGQSGKRRLFDEIGDSVEVVEGQKSGKCRSKKDRRGKGKGSRSMKMEDQTVGPSDGKLEGEVMAEGAEESELMAAGAEESELMAAGAEESELFEKVLGEKCDTIDIEVGNSVQLVEMEGLHVDDEMSRSGHLEKTIQCNKQMETIEGEKDIEDCMVRTEAVVGNSDKLDDGASCMAKEATSPDVGGKTLNDMNVEVDKLKQFSTDVFEKQHIGAGRRCGLCGRGTDGKPPKRLVTDHTDSDKETYGGSSSCEEGHYDILDGFGDEPGWLGRLLGPIHDRFGIADVWVHQHCAVWSPEVYFAGLGCLKNVRAALSRGKALKCSRCGRPGATIGCRVDRCPKTYHLPCGRAGGCIFDHRKFLIACHDHRHLFEPYRNNNLQRLKKLKARKLKLVTRKLSHDAWKRDFEAEEKWLENCGEDEEFLKREGKRLHRDILRIAPVYIGGPSTETEKLYRGWESVAGLQDVIRCLKEVVILPLLYPEFFTNIGLTPPRGVLLHGYPGTGKTHIVRALIGSCARGDRRIAYFARKGADCLGKYVGDAERQLRLLFQIAEKSQPSIIFFDEIDGLAPCRTRQQDQTHNSVVSTLLALMDGLKSRGSVIVIGATNRPDAVDPALRRPGRFDREIYFPLPSVKDRAAILSLHTQNWPKPISGSLLRWIAQKTSGFAGADLQALCTQAAMIALRRNCPLQELMCAAEKKANNGGRLPLPACLVEETDWLDALACAPPPCSRREAGMTANEVVSSPLHAHLFPCLLQPLSYLLVSLYLDERVWLPPFLYNAANLIRNVITSALNLREKPSDLWWSYLPDLVKEADIARQIEKTLSSSGFLISGSDFGNYSALPDDNEVGTEYEFCKVRSAGAGLVQNASCSGRKIGFRVLITGHPKSGQRHLSSCLLHGFVGCVEIQKVDLATISQEGRGDMVEGMTNILLKCSSKGVYIIYMPRIDLWAIDTQYEEDEKEADTNRCESTDTAGPCDASKTASRLWNSFIEQVDSICLSTSLMILATSEVRSEELPDSISQFFTSNVMRSNDIVASEYTMPRFIVQVGGSFDYEMVINSYATRLSKDLIQEYVQLLHHRTHAALTSNENAASVSISEEAGRQIHTSLGGAVAEGTNVTNSIRTTSEGVGFLHSNETEQHLHDQCPTMFTNTDHQKPEDWLHDNAIPRFVSCNKAVKGKSNLLLAISSFGYQILRYPHFAELCWTTSKLKEGPCADISGPWKGWPFHTCIVRPGNSSEKVSLGRSSNSVRGREYFGVVRGLIAVGLLAYKGVYTSIKQVSFEVRKVLELVVAQINFKILAGKDKSRFHHLLSQVAYLEDMVNSWAYTLKSLECNSTSTVSPGSATLQYPNVHQTSELNVESDGCKDKIPQKSSDEVVVLEQSEFIDPNEGKGNTHLDLPNSEATAINPKQPLHEMASHKYIKILHGSSGIFENSNGLTNDKSIHIFESGVSSHDESSGMNSSCRKVDKECKGMSTEKMGLKPNDSAHESDEAMENANISLKENTSFSVPSVSRLTCFYSCCFNCIDSVYVLIRKILMREWKAIGSSLTVEDANDAVCSWSTNLLCSIRKFYDARNFSKSELICKNLTDETDTRFCSCSVHRHANGSAHHTSSANRGVEPLGCSFHSKSKDVAENKDACLDSETGLQLKYVFKDNVLISSDLDKDVLFHCKFQNLCLSSLIESILMIKQPLS